MISFDWQEYMEKTKSLPVPEDLFVHVENSLNNGIKQGMLLEVSHKKNPDVYWIAEITMVCGHLLRIKFVGAESDFWCDIAKTKVHPLGWCGKYDEFIEPPDDINDRYGDNIIEIMKDALITGVSVTVEALDNNGLSPIDRIKEGMKVEVQNNLDPHKFWIATIVKNIGGRLLLHYDGSDEDLEDIWIFYSSLRLFNFGFVTTKGSPWQFKYPGKINKFSCKNKLSAQLKMCAEDAIKNPTPNDLFPGKQLWEPHHFIIGMKLEALDPQTMDSVRPATVVKVFNSFHFLVILDDHVPNLEDSEAGWLCHVMHPYIYPIGWAQKNKVTFTSPKIWSTSKEFDWDEYLSMTSSVPAPDYCFGMQNTTITNDFGKNMTLEAVNPKNENEIEAAIISHRVEHMLCVQLLCSRSTVWYHSESENLFPIGWCTANNYALQEPLDNIEKVEVKPQSEPEIHKETIKMQLADEWCDRIFFNYKCYAGPMISRNKLSQLPKHVGPGPLSLVIKEVLNMIISASYKPAKLLKDWECDGNADDGMRLEMLKAKLKTSTYHAYVQVVCSAEDVSMFCRDTCCKLQACPFLFGPTEFIESCPERCTQVDKSKFQITTIERRGRPKGSLSKSSVPKCWTAGRKKRRKGLHFMTIRARERRAAMEAEGIKECAESGNESDNSPNSTPQQSESGTRPNSPDSIGDRSLKKQRKKREPRTNYPKLEMKTRGAKLPNFAQQMKESHWNKKDVETIYNNTCVPKKHSHDSDSENDTSSSNYNETKNNDLISDVSDSEEPELKKLRFTPIYDPQPTDIKMFENNLQYNLGQQEDSFMSWVRYPIKLASNPAKWTINDVYNYLMTTDCKTVADKLRDQEIDGAAFIMLNLPMLREFLHLRMEPALQLCKHITMIKWYYLVNYDNNSLEMFIS